MTKQFLSDYRKLILTFKDQYSQEGINNFQDNQMILYHLRQINSIITKGREDCGDQSTASFENRKILTEIGMMSIFLPGKE